MLSPARNRLGLLSCQGAMSVFMLALALGLVAQGGTPVFTVTSPAAGATVPSGIVVVEFAAQNFTLGDQGQTHLHFYVGADPVRFDFYNGASGNPDQGVQQNGLHSHFVHWASPTSIQMFGVAPGAHQVRFVLANANHSELTNPEATMTLNFTVSQPPEGEFTLQSVLSGLNFPLAMAFAPDGRVFYDEWTTGRIRVVQPNFGAGSTFFTVSNLVTGGERGLLGLALDPAFATNHFVYAYYTASNPLRNKIIRLTDANGVGTNETVIVDNLPASGANHNGGVIQFGPDGKLYVVTGDVENTNNSQNTNSLAGKILRYNKDGSIPAGNPFGNTPVWAYGLRNSFGFTFHPHTGDLWETENGPASDDEVNRIVAGGNYGWPNVTGIANNPQFIDPIVEITPTIAPTGIVAVGENSNYPARYHNNLLFTDFNTGRIRRIVLTGAGLTQLGSFSVAYNGGNGFLLDIDQAADGFIYVSSDSGIFRLNVPGDTTAPTISSVASSSITTTGATIAWTTNEASDTQVEYGTTTTYGSTTTLNASMVTNHSVSLSGLTAGTLYHYRVRSRDAAGNLATSADFTFTTSGAPDTTAPTVSITAPANGATVRSTITVNASASDAVGVAGVQFRLDDANLGSEDTTASYQISWNTTTASNGPHTLAAIARDLAGNTATSSGITVTVDNALPAISNVASSNITTSGATITWTTDEPSDTQVDYGISTSYGSRTTRASALVTSHTASITGLSPNTLYHYRVRSRDAAGNLARSSDFTLTTASGTPDSTAPTVNLVSPTGGASIRGTVTIIANANDNIGVTGVQFQLDSANLGVEDTSSPFQVSWDTTQALNGSHTLSAIAHDAAGNSTTSAAVILMVDNSAPTVSITSLAGGSTISGTINITATAEDNLGVVGVQFRLDGSPLGAEDISPLYSISWNSATVLNGSHTLTAVARDAAGNQTVSASVPITVLNSGGPFSVTLVPIADSYVRSDNLAQNYGTSTELHIRLGDASNPITIRSYLKFTLSGLVGTVTGAKLRLWVLDGGTSRGNIYSVSNTWSETSIAWSNAPPQGTLYLNGTSVPAPLGTWVEMDLPAGIFAGGNGDYSFLIVGGNSNRVHYSSRQGISPPQLVLTVVP